MSDTLLVVPFYNEAERFRREVFEAYAAAHPDVGFVLVDDGSTDATRARLEELVAAAPGRFELVALERNAGKAEAVRRGMLAALARGPRFAGYWDADLATPLEELDGFRRAFEEHPERDVVFGSRVLLLGRTIDRSAARHYLGRVFATAASRVLELPVYDTQCGAKLFRVGPDTGALFAEPFVTGWTFDVELIARLSVLAAREGARPAAERVYELPLRTWRDVPGSKVKPLDFVRGLVALWRIRRHYRGRAVSPASATPPAPTREPEAPARGGT